jgi:hypothetical protein
MKLELERQCRLSVSEIKNSFMISLNLKKHMIKPLQEREKNQLMKNTSSPSIEASVPCGRMLLSKDWNLTLTTSG